ncbi:1,4-alpha-glucan branching protein GlgB [Glaciecola sp. 1036]|uniref:1,4-alpha-glucan branching protein GlgB n=1 Tax=Alteromonadaceae TaxID=72275 RepID=UPI003D036A5B
MHIAQKLSERRCDNPFSVLGHHIEMDQVTIRVFVPSATKISLSNTKGKSFLTLDAKGNGIFEGICALNSFHFPYRIEATSDNGEFSFIDPYQFKDEAYHAVHFIDHLPDNLYRQAGAQLITSDSGVKGVRFAVFAPNASSVSVIGNFNYWDKTTHQMQKTNMGFWVLFVPGVRAGDEYKFALKDANNNELPDKMDPLGFYHHQYPSHVSVVYDHEDYQWQDQEWQTRTGVDHYHSPMSVYEVHLGSWKRPWDPERRYLSYRDLASDLIGYVSEMGYTHIEVMPVSEYPFDGSWGYQPVGLFAPTSRFGEPDDFKFFVDQCHKAGIGVIIDWVPAHFPEDDHGLAKFDGSHVYEYEDPRKGWHPDWNSCIYDFGKQSVRQFLVANALYWFDKFHIDGIRVDAVASMLYLDYSRKENEWIPNVDGGNHNYEAISLLQWMNTEVYKKFPNAMTIAEESTSYPGVSRPVSQGGLGFGFKWNMGWMHDTLTYISKDPAYRSYHHSDLTFSMVYAYDENFVLPISHDEVVHGKGSMLQKMPGDPWQKFANLRAYFSFMFAHPGKKLHFMGCEIAQFQEWNHDGQLDWATLQDHNHQGVQSMFKALNQVYRQLGALHQLDHEHRGFRWLDLHNSEQAIIAFLRFDNSGKVPVVVICNFTPVPRQYMRFGVPEKGRYSLVFNSDRSEFGGSSYPVQQQVHSIDNPWQEQPFSIEIDIPPLATVMFTLD